MTPRPDVSAERKPQILDAALRVFIRQGIQHTRMDDIVTEAGLSKGALYWYFTGKDEIVAAVVARVFASELADLVAAAGLPGSVRSRLETYTEHAARALESLTHVRPVLYELYALSARDETIRQAMQAQVRDFVAVLAPLIEEGIRNGEFRALDAADVALVAGAMFEGVHAVRMYDQQRVSLRRHIGLGIALLLDGLKNDKGAGA